MNIILKSIPHSEQRYETVGDWQELPDGSVVITVSDMGNEDFNALVAIHELVEYLLCKKRGITDEEVTAFDKAFEEARQPGNTDEPGDQVAAPYFQEHQFASYVETVVAVELGVSLEGYTKAVNSL